MKIKNRIVAAGLAVVMSFCALTGCGFGDKGAVRETAEKFLEALKQGNENEINAYASGEVASGNFVKLFDSDYLVEELKSGFGESELTPETEEKIDNFCKLFSNMIKEYEVSKIEINKDKSATAIATIKTTFPVDVINSDEAKAKIDEATTQYYNDKQDELVNKISEEGDEAAQQMIFNDMALIVLDIYQEVITSSGEESYAIAFTLNKNTETGTWYVTDIKDYDTYVDPTNAGVATDTATTDMSLLESTKDASAESSDN